MLYCFIHFWPLKKRTEINYCIFSEQLGDRLEKESISNPKLANNAQLCYIVAGCFDKLVSSWSEKASNSINDLQELVELVMFLQKSVERQGKKVEVNN